MPYIVWSHKCRKCKGQFYLEENEDGAYLVCIQCGHSEKIKEQVTTLPSASRPNDKVALMG
jgi:DNA-directed RNA polymerase subunit RPC12/RpoP